MPTTTTFKDVLDLPEWRPLAPSSVAFGAGSEVASDLRNTEDRYPCIFQFAALTNLLSYSCRNDGWQTLGSPAMAGTFSTGTGLVVAPARGPRGTLAAGATTTKITLSTALPAAVAGNQLASRDGDGVGFKIRVIGNGVGGSGKTEERRVIANTSGTTPTLVLDSALSFTPVAGDTYEFLSGRVYMLTTGAAVAGQWKYYDILTCSFSGNLGVTNLSTSGSSDSILIALDEQYVPCDNVPGEGFVTGTGTGGVGRALVATTTAAGTLTGQAAGGDAGVLANEWRNFQIRIVQDTVNTTAVGQRRRITSHTAGPSPVYTLAGNWTVAPSANAQYVIENNNEIILFGNASTTTFVYAQDTYGTAQTGDTWSTAIYGARGGAVTLGQCAFQAFGVAASEYAKDVDKNFRYSFIFGFRGNAVTLDVLDIAGGANGLWANNVTYGSSGTSIASGNGAVYDPVSSTGLGKYLYLNPGSGQLFYRFNAFTRQLAPWTYLRYTASVVVVGTRLGLESYIDGSTRLSFVFVGRAGATEAFHILTQR